MKRVLLLALFASTLVACSAQATQEPNRFFEPQGDFSFVPPDGWTAQDFPGFKYQIVTGEPSDGFAPNINVVDEAFQGSLEDYVDGNIATMQQVFHPLTIVSRAEFSRHEGLPGIRLSVETVQQDFELRQTFYFFPDSGRYFVVTCTRLVQTQASVDALCDQSMETFRVER